MSKMWKLCLFTELNGVKKRPDFQKSEAQFYGLLCVCVCGHIYVVYEDTNLYNDMGMT